MQAQHMQKQDKIYLPPTFSYRTIFKSLIVGALAGGVTVAFRVCATQLFSASQNLAHYAQANPLGICLWFAVLFLAAWIVARLLKWEPMISGSGIPQVEGELKNLFSQNPFKILIGKFCGGLLALGAGLSLGREGPCIQMGAVIGKGLAHKKDSTEKKLLLTSGGAAGLAAAFGAPLAGVLFALEEVHKSCRANILFNSIAACAVSGIVTRLLLGPVPIFNMGTIADFPMESYWLLLPLGVAIGLLGALYNLCVAKMQNVYQRMKKIPAPYRVIIPFAAAGILAFILPAVLGGGAFLVPKIAGGNFAFAALAVILAAKFLFSVFSFSSGVPGGILMPTLVIGALLGGVIGSLLAESTGLPASVIPNFVLFAMAGLFGAIVRAPLTGIVLVCEMSGAYSAFLPLIITTLVSCLVARALHAQPVYDQLLARDLKLAKQH